MQKHIRMQACTLPEHQKMQESCSLNWGLWDGPVCILKPAHGRPQLGHNLGIL